MKLPEFNLFSDKSARILLPSICPNFHGFPNFFLGWGKGAGVSCPPLLITLNTHSYLNAP